MSSQLEWYHRNKALAAQRNKRYRDGLGPTVTKDRAYRKKHGMTYQQVLDLLASQGNACPICSAPIQGMAVLDGHLDHCHKTNRVRGVLCHNCNKGLGHFKDNPSTLLKAITYLRDECDDDQ